MDSTHRTLEERARLAFLRKANEPAVSFIAEVSSNHARNLKRCLDFVDTAAKVG